MQRSVEKKLINSDQEFQSEAEISRDFYSHLKITGHLQEDELEFHDFEEEEEEVEEEEEEEGRDEEFSFYCGEPSTSPIAADDVFANGQIKPVFPFFGRDSPFLGEDPAGLRERLPLNPPVRKVFVETGENGGGGGMESSFGLGSDDIVGPVCEWSSRKAVEASVAADQVCKKSNSTGFSKIWRFKEFVGIRSNSDGRDAFVFLNHGGHAAAEEKKEPASLEKKKEVKKGRKSSKTASLSAHEEYLRSKAKEEERRRSYLPYRPELVGFFTNVNGALTKNVHPF